MRLGKCIEIGVNIEKGVFFGDFSNNVGISQFLSQSNCVFFIGGLVSLIMSFFIQEYEWLTADKREI